MVRNLTMEPTFYEDQAGTLYCPPVGRMMVNGPMSHGALGSIKRSNLTLDLNSARQGLSKRPSKLGSALTTPSSLPSLTPLLGSPDQLLKLATPEFERLLVVQQQQQQHHHHQQNQESCIITTVAPTTTPSGGLHTPTSQIYFEKAVTEEQENYALGFVEALNELHHSDSSQEPGSLHGATYTTLEPPGSVQSNESSSMLSSQGLVQIKDEPHTVPSVSSSPPMSPINMESQERIKLERKRQRNRVAASKCRRRKLERISRLEDKVKLLKGENSDLSQVASRLRDHVFKLKEQVIEHVNAGCQIQALPCTF